jgi:serine protease Do
MSVPAKLKTIAVAAAVVAGVGAAATAYLPHATAVSKEETTSAVSSTPAPTLTVPDFTTLVQQNADSVVNITVEGKGPGPMLGIPDLENIPEPFRRFFPPTPRGDDDNTPRARGMGSGFIISSDGYVVTNHHVVAGADRITVKLNDKREFTAKLVGSDKQSDVALLKIDATGLPAAKIGDSSRLKVGQWVFAIGAPFGLERTATQGIVSALGRSLPSDTYTPFIQTDVAVNPGNSGGPLFDTAGRVVGINSQIFSRSGGYMGLSFAIPIDVAMNVVAQLKEHGYVERGWLGIQLQEVTQDLARSFGLQSPRGALVANVTPGSPADTAGVKTGDVIVAYADKPIDDSSDLPPLVGATRPGESRTLTIVRNGKERKLDVMLGKLEDREVKLAANGNAKGDSAVLNVVVSDLTDAQRKQLGVEQGVLVRQVGPGMAAEAGVRPGDVLLEIDGKQVGNAQQLRELARQLPAGKSVPVLVKRGEVALFLALRVPEGYRG